MCIERGGGGGGGGGGLGDRPGNYVKSTFRYSAYLAMFAVCVSPKHPGHATMTKLG